MKIPRNCFNFLVFDMGIAFILWVRIWTIMPRPKSIQDRPGNLEQAGILLLNFVFYTLTGPRPAVGLNRIQSLTSNLLVLGLTATMYRAAASSRKSRRMRGDNHRQAGLFTPLVYPPIMD